MTTDADLCFMPATDLAALIRAGSLAPMELVDALLARIERVDPTLNAFITVTADQARQGARRAQAALAAGSGTGALHGVPIAIKDLLYTAGVRTTAGSQIYRDHVPRVNALAVQRALDAGAILLGKTSTPEFGFKSSTENALVGATCNPWDRLRTAGGSSGGAAAAAASGLAPLGLGTDGGGSIRTPASFCGIVGFKPTFGLVPNGPGFGGGATIAHTGPMARTVADCALLLDVIAGHAESDRTSVPAAPGSYRAALATAPQRRRVAWSPDLGYAPVDPEVLAATTDAVATMATLGWDVDETSPGFDDPEAVFNVIIRAENHVATHALAARHPELLDPGLLEFIRNGAAVTTLDYLEANAARERLCARMAALFERVDLLVTPTLAVPPFLLDQRPREIAGRPVSGMNWLSFTYPFNLTGNPAVSVPCGWSAAGLPIGLQIVGPRHRDGRVLAAAAALEAARPWADQRPPLGD